MNISQKSAAINKIGRGLFLLLHVAALHSPQAGSLSAACLPRVKQVFRAWQTSKRCAAQPARASLLRAGNLGLVPLRGIPYRQGRAARLLGAVSPPVVL